MIAKKLLLLGSVALIAMACGNDSSKKGKDRAAATGDVIIASPADTNPTAEENPTTTTTETATEECATTGTNLVDQGLELNSSGVGETVGTIFQTITGIIQCIAGQCTTIPGSTIPGSTIPGTTIPGTIPTNIGDIFCRDGKCFDRLGNLIGTLNGSTTTPPNGNTSGTTTTTTTGSTTGSCLKLTWSNVSAIFNQSCNSCHTHANEFISEAAVRAKKSSILTTVTTGTMPQLPTTLDATSKALLLQYVNSL